MPALFANNAVAKLAANAETHHTQLSLETGQGALFPNPDTDLGEYFTATLAKADGQNEIIRVTAVSGDTLTVERGRETTVPLDFAAGDAVELRLTGGGLSGMVQREEMEPDSSSRLKNLWYVAANPAIADHGDASARGSLAWVLAQAGVARAEVHLPAEHDYTLATDLTVPANITLAVHNGAVLNVTGTAALTLNCDLRAGNQRIFSGTGTVAGTLGGRAARPQWWGAVADGATDDSEAVELALAFAQVFFCAGTYVVSRPLQLTANSSLSGPAPLAGFLDWDNDWQKPAPTYAGRAAVLQYPQGQHGAIFQAASHVAFRNLVFRCGQTRTQADVLISGQADHVAFSDCRFENLENLLTGSTAFGGLGMERCRVFGCSTPLSGPMVDAVIEACTFTSCGICLNLTQGAGFNVVSGCRFEWCKQALHVYQSRANAFSGNIFDASEEAAATLHASTDQVLTGNVFWRNGRNGLESEKRSHLVLKEAGTGSVIRSNTFLPGGEDTGGENLWPQYVVEVVSSAGARVQFAGNAMDPGCLNMPVYDTWWNSSAALDLDAVSLRGLGNPDEDSDQLIEMIKQVDHVACGPVDAHVFENRAWTVYTDLEGRKIRLIGHGGVTLRDTTGRANRLMSLQDVNYGVAFGPRVAAMSATAPPTLGFWQRGAVVWNSAPASGAAAGWMCVAEGAPGTWRAFANVA